MVKKGKKRGNKKAAQVTTANPAEDEIDLNEMPSSNTKKSLASSMNVLAIDSDSDSDDELPLPPTSGAKSGVGGNKMRAAASALALDSDDDDESDDEPAAPPPKKFSAAAAALDLGDSEDDEDNEPTPPPSPPKSKKAQKKAKKKAAAMAAALALDDSDDDDDQEANEDDFIPPAVKAPEPEPEPEPVAQTSKAKKKKKKKNKKVAAANDDDFDALLADVTGTPVAAAKDDVTAASADALADAIESTEPEKKLTKAQLKRKKQKEKKAKAAAAAAGGESKTVEPDATAEKGGDSIDALLADIDSAEPEKKLSKAQQKRLRRKQAEEAKAKAAGAGGDETPTAGNDTPAASEETPAAEAEETSGKKKRRKKKKGKGADDSKKAGKPMSAIARRAQEAKRLREEAEAAIRAAQEEEQRLIREEEERIAREEADKEAKKLAKKQRRKDNIARARADGTYKTAAEKRKAAAAAERLEQLKAMGILPGKAKDRKKPVYTKKQKGPGKKFGADKLFEAQQKALEEAKAKAAAAEAADDSDDDDESDSEEEDDSEETEGDSEEPSTPTKEEEEDSADAGEADGSDDDDWDADSDDEKPKKKASTKKATHATKQSAYGDDDWDASSGDDQDVSSSATKKAAESDDDWDASSGDEEEENPKWTPKARQKKQPAKKSEPKPKKPMPKAKNEEQKNGDVGAKVKPKTNGVDPLMVAKPKKGKKGKKGKKNKPEKEKINVVAKTKEAKKVSKRKRDLRSPICCVLGHVDTGKTKLLDKIRKSSVQDHEEGGITQQIGATFFPMDRIKAQTAEVNALQKRTLKYHLPGLLIIDTPGHESFSNLRKRGANLCDIAVLVVDIMHGLEPQTRESIQILTRQNVPFVVALNKIDRIYDWKPIESAPFEATLAQQGDSQKAEFERRVQEVTLQFNEIGHNCALYTKVRDIKDTVALVPTSAHTGEGIPDMLMLLVQMTQHMMADQLQYLTGPEATVLEVKVTEGLGHTIDVILSNGTLKCNDKIILCGMNGPIVTHVKALLVPAPLKEIRVKGEYMRLQEVKASMGIRISAANLEHTIAGTSLLVCGPRDNEDAMMDAVMADYADVQARIMKHNKRGVFVQSSTLGALEALLDYLNDQKIPVMGVALGPVHKKQVMSAATMLSHQREYACILAFNVKIDRDAQDYADREGVRIFSREIIYNLTDDFTAYLDKIKADRRAASSDKAVFPCVLEIKSAAHVFHNHNPIIVGCIVKQGMLKIGTPLCAMFDKADKSVQQYVEIGTVESLEKDNKQVEVAMPGDELAVKIAQNQMQHHIYYGRQFTLANPLCSVLTRESVDVLKTHFRDDIIENDLVSLIGRLGVFFGFINKKR